MPRKKKASQAPPSSPPAAVEVSSPLAPASAVDCLEAVDGRVSTPAPSPPLSPSSGQASLAKSLEVSPSSPGSAVAKSMEVSLSSPAVVKSREAPPSVPDLDAAKAYKSVDEVTGIPPLFPENPAVTGKTPWSSVVKSSNDDLSFPALDNLEYNAAGKIKLSLNDVAEELDYWSSSVVCHVLGANPPVQVIAGFLKKIWNDLGIDKVASLGKGYYIVKFVNVDDRNAALDRGTPFFDKKPMIVRPGSATFNINLVDEIKVPVWTRLTGLPLKFWGRNTLPKISSDLGKPLRMDKATASKERLSFARVLIEMDIQKAFPAGIQFEDETGQMIDIPVTYEWTPIKCTHCSLFGHNVDTCKKLENAKKKCAYCNLIGHTKEECRKKGKQPIKQNAKPALPAVNKANKPTAIPAQKKQDTVSTSNRFDLIQEDLVPVQEDFVQPQAAHGLASSSRKMVIPPPDTSDFPPLSING